MTGTPLPAFEQAALRCPPEELCVRVGALFIRIRVAGPKLAKRLFDPMRHIVVPASAEPAQITACAWSVEETGVPVPDAVDWETDEPLEWSDGGRGLIVSCFPGAEELPRIAIARPFQWSLIALLAERGLSPVHGALVSAPAGGAGLLLLGPNGSGKSTTCLSAIQAGFRLVGEDCIAAERTADGFLGHSLYCSCNVTMHTRDLFPNLPGPVLFPHGAPSDAKAIVLLQPDGPNSPMRRTMPIGALVFPVVTGENGGSRIVRISRGEAYRRFMPGLRQAKKMSQVQRHAHHDALLPLIDLPAFRIELGSDVTAIPACLAQVSGMTE